MTALNMPQATSLAETPPLNLRDYQYRAEAIAARILDIRNLLVGIDHIQQDRITAYADVAQCHELSNACDQIASMHVITIEALQTLASQADELANLLIPGPSSDWDAAVKRWRDARAVADEYHAPFTAGAHEHTEQTAAEANRLDNLAGDALDELMAQPAPDFGQLRFKLERLLDDELSPWTSDYVAQTRRDVARLLGEA